MMLLGQLDHIAQLGQPREADSQFGRQSLGAGGRVVLQLDILGVLAGQQRPDFIASERQDRRQQPRQLCNGKFNGRQYYCDNPLGSLLSDSIGIAILYHFQLI